MDVLVESTSAGPIIRSWQQFKSQHQGNSLHSAGPHDTVTGWREFLMSHQSDGHEFSASRQPHHQEFTRLAQHPYRSAEEAWTAAKHIEAIPAVHDVTLAGLTDYLTRLAEALRRPEPMLGTDEVEASGAPAQASVGDCFAQAGLWWVAVFFFALVVLIVGIALSGGGLAAVAAQILGILIGAGIWATFGGVIALVICLGGSVDIQINY